MLDGDGSIGFYRTSKVIVICFHEKDQSLAYFIKSTIGFGKVSKIKNKRAFKYVLTKKSGLIFFCRLIYNKLMISSKIINYNKLIIHLNMGLSPSTLNLIDFYSNSYLAGLIDSDGCFTIRIFKNKRKEVRLYLRISLKEIDLVKLIFKQINPTAKKYPKVRVHPRGHTSLEANTVSFSNMCLLLQYLDKFPLQSKKYLEYIIIRKAYLIIQSKEHLTEKGFNNLCLYQHKLSNLKK